MSNKIKLKKNFERIFSVIEWISQCPWYPELVGDGFCDDFLNHKGCHYDHGDCCSITASHKYCKKCQCIVAVDQLKISQDKCADPQLVHDGECDDHLNTIECGLDGGDCCNGDSIFCSDCICKLPDWPNVTSDVFNEINWNTNHAALPGFCESKIL